MVTACGDESVDEVVSRLEQMRHVRGGVLTLLVGQRTERASP